MQQQFRITGIVIYTHCSSSISKGLGYRKNGKSSSRRRWSNARARARRRGWFTNEDRGAARAAAAISSSPSLCISPRAIKSRERERGSYARGNERGFGIYTRVECARRCNTYRREEILKMKVSACEIVDYVGLKIYGAILMLKLRFFKVEYFLKSIKYISIICC